jgi:hypothetical protein
MTRAEMDELTKGLITKSAKIRRLEDHGVSRSEIANYLGIRYQHVRNVLIAPRPKRATDEVQASAATVANALTIDQAKRGLAVQFGVPVETIEITIRG